MSHYWLFRTCCEDDARWDIQKCCRQCCAPRASYQPNVCKWLILPLLDYVKADLNAQNRKAEYVIFHEILETGNKTFIRDITKIEKKWLLEYAPDYYQIRG